MKFTNPDDVFSNVPMDNDGIRQYTDTINFVDHTDLGERIVTLNGARLKVKRIAKDLKINRRYNEANKSNPMVGRNLLDKTNVTQLRTQALVGGTLKYLLSGGAGSYVTGVKVGGDNFHRHFNDDGVGNAGYGSGYNVVGRPAHWASYLSDKLLEVADPVLMTNLPYLQPNEVWPSTQIDTTPYPTSMSSRIGTDLNVKMTSANIPGKEISDLTFRVELNDVNLNIEDFPRLDINPNKKFGPFQYKTYIVNWDKANLKIVSSVGDRDKTTTEKIDYGVLQRGILANYNETLYSGAHWMQSLLATAHPANGGMQMVYPICEQFTLSNAHFRISYSQYSSDLPRLSFGMSGNAYNPFRGDRFSPRIGDLAVGDNPDQDRFLPRFMALWAIEGNNNYVEIDIDDGANLYVKNSDANERYFALTSIRGTGNVVVIRLKQPLWFYGNSKNGNSAIAWFTMISNNPDKNVVYILGPKGQNISESLLFNTETNKSDRRRMLLGCLNMDLYHALWIANPLWTTITQYDKYRSDYNE